jgi:hypothetical protein
MMEGILGLKFGEVEIVMSCKQRIQEEDFRVPTRQ